MASSLSGASAYRPDLHLHSTASDGKLCAADVVIRAGEQGVNLIALTDHDSMAGLHEAEAEARRQGIGFIPGVEISAEGELELHVLGYFVHRNMEELGLLLEKAAEDRRLRKGRFLKRLNELGMPLEDSDIPTPPGTPFSRSHLAEAMVRRGYAKDVPDAFNRWSGVGRPAYVPRLNFPAVDVFRMLRREGAVPVLAHPGLGNKLPEDHGDRLQQWRDAGLMGIEAYHPGHSREVQDAWLSYARRQGLLVTGGSDFHRIGDSHHGEIGQMLARWSSASSDAAALLEAGPAV